MRHLTKYKIFEAIDWGNLFNILIDGYWSKLVEENDLLSLIDDVEDVVITLSDISQKTVFYKSIFVTYQKNPKGKRRLSTPDTWSRRGLKQITTDGEKYHIVKELSLMKLDHSGVYSKFTETKSFLSKATESEVGWFGIDLTFYKIRGGESQIAKEFELIKDNFKSRGWSFNAKGYLDEYVYDTVGSFGFDIIRPISLKSANRIVPELFAKTSILLNEKNSNSLDFIKESYPPHPFHIESERKFNKIKSDLEDILLEITDSNIKVSIHKYIDDIIFEIQIYISEIKTKQDKKLVEECVLRISSFLEIYRLSILGVNMVQCIDGENHVFYFYDLSEIENLDSSAGTIKLEIVFGEHS